MAEVVFKFIWGGLLAVAVTAQVLFKGRVARRADMITNALVALPYLLVFVLFSVRARVGLFTGSALTQWTGLALMLVGAVGYMVAIAYLGRNWAVSAAVKDGHTLMDRGPYRLARHPMYSCIIVVILGSGLLISDFLIIAAVPAVVFLYYVRARKEEEMLKQALPGYEAYAKKTRMFC